MGNLGLRYFSALLRDKEENFSRLKDVKREWFQDISIRVYDFVNSHLENHGCLPQESESIKIEFGIDLPKEIKEPLSYYESELQNRHYCLKMAQVSKNIANHVEGQNSKEAIAEAIKACEFEVEMVKSEGGLLVPSEECDKILKLYQSIEDSKGLSGFSTGNRLVDWYTGGYRRGDLFMYTARPQMGKSWELINSFNHCVKSGAKCVFFTFEMTVEECTQRLHSIRYTLPWGDYFHGKLGTAKKEQYAERFRSDCEQQKYKDLEYFVGNGSVEEIKQLAMFINQIKPDIVFIDGAYILDVEGEKDEVRKNAKLAKFFKKLAMQKNVAIVATSQLNREVFEKGGKKEKSSNYTAGLHNLAYSDAWGQYAVNIIAIQGDKDLENHGLQLKSFVKCRNAKNPPFFICEFNFNKMSFDLVGVQCEKGRIEPFTEDGDIIRSVDDFGSENGYSETTESSQNNDNIPF